MGYWGGRQRIDVKLAHLASGQVIPVLEVPCPVTLV